MRNLLSAIAGLAAACVFLLTGLDPAAAQGPVRYNSASVTLGEYWDKGGLPKPLTGVVLFNPDGTLASISGGSGGSSGTVAQGSTTASQQGMLMQCAVVTGNQAYTSGQTNPCNLTPTGRLKVGLGAAGNPDHAPQLSTTIDSLFIGAKYRATPQTWADGDQGGLSTDNLGSLLTASLDRYQTGPVDSSGTGSYLMPLNGGAGTGGVVISGLSASGATFTPEGSFDGVNYVTVPVIIAGQKTTTTAITADGQYRVNLSGRRGFRFRVTTPGSGTVTFTSTVSNAAYDPPAPTLDTAGAVPVQFFGNASSVANDNTLMGQAKGANAALGTPSDAANANTLVGQAKQSNVALGGASSVANDNTLVGQQKQTNVVLGSPSDAANANTMIGQLKQLNGATAAGTNFIGYANPKDMTPVTTTQGAANGTVLFAVDTTDFPGGVDFSLLFANTPTMTVSFQQSNDGTFANSNTALTESGNATTSSSVAVAGSATYVTYHWNGGARYFRALVSSWTAGTVNATAFMRSIPRPNQITNPSTTTGVGGNIASGVTDAGNPVKVGCYANGAAPTTVTAGQRANLWCGLNGQVATFLSDTIGNAVAVGTLASSPTTSSSGLTVRSTPYIYNGTGFDKQVDANTANNTTGTGISAMTGLGIGSNTAPTAVTAGNYVRPWYTLNGAGISVIYGAGAALVSNFTTSLMPQDFGGTSRPLAIAQYLSNGTAWFSAPGDSTAGAYTQFVPSAGAQQGAATVPSAAAFTNSLKGSAGNLFSLDLVNTAASNVAGFIVVYDAATAPASGTALTTTSIKYCMPVGANAGFDKVFNVPIPFTAGIQELWSTSCTNYTSPTVAPAYMSGQAK